MDAASTVFEVLLAIESCVLAVCSVSLAVAFNVAQFVTVLGVPARRERLIYRLPQNDPDRGTGHLRN